MFTLTISANAANLLSFIARMGQKKDQDLIGLYNEIRFLIQMFQQYSTEELNDVWDEAYEDTKTICRECDIPETFTVFESRHIRSSLAEYTKSIVREYYR